MKKMTIKDIKIKDKKLLIRVDFNVPFKNGIITDDTRIKASLPTITYALKKGAKVVLFSHLGRIKKDEDKINNSLKPVASHLSKLLGKKVTFIPETRGKKLETAIAKMTKEEIILVENTRFEDVPGNKESKNDSELGAYWASLGDIFVNDAFGTIHRSHASNVGISSTGIPSVIGLLVQKEIKFIRDIIKKPRRPMIAILGGAKISDKISVIENLILKADKILIGGGMVYTFYKAKGMEVGNSLIEEDKIELAKSLIEKAGEKLILPIDSITANEFSNDAQIEVHRGCLPKKQMGLDIGPETIKVFIKILENAKTIFWSGPMGVFEMANFAKGTIGMCEAIANLKDSVRIIGGGDSASAAKNLGFSKAFTHISTGGGAILKLLEEKELPGLISIYNK